MKAENRITTEIMGSNIDSGSWSDFVQRIALHSESSSGGHVCVCNVHSVVTATKQPELAKSIERALLATPDGMPLVWLIRRRIRPSQERINGPDLMLKLCDLAQNRDIPIGIFGSTAATNGKLIQKLLGRFPNLKISLVFSPPYNDVNEWPLDEYISEMNSSGAKIVFVGLGCPKQEIFMDLLSDKVSPVLLGVGAAFDYHAEVIARPPRWMQESGLEWLGRLYQEPKRLLGRYISTNLPFAIRYFPELLGLVRSSR